MGCWCETRPPSSSFFTHPQNIGCACKRQCIHFRTNGTRSQHTQSPIVGVSTVLVCFAMTRRVIVWIAAWAGANINHINHFDVFTEYETKSDACLLCLTHSVTRVNQTDNCSRVLYFLVSCLKPMSASVVENVQMSAAYSQPPHTVLFNGWLTVRLRESAASLIFCQADLAGKHEGVRSCAAVRHPPSLPLCLSVRLSVFSPSLPVSLPV